ncbi:MAG: 4-hydroxy-3-methylbut-2-enyl diphosphate reductase [Synergistetes bacterium]|nr:4-hydroxy-3-methylbut-2-enyl diphosphate reductase [Synergistota bacterium]MCX8128233.1 4-hydroxy-3-methylbut-2-enyl diphosphate reductase [Synergistota bacterium]MDW8192680.1 4-hydroxy-3-methylbut-2-enyl diphosphate reductase [Synergistota bacterium]
MKVLLSSEIGFCFGVKRAVNIVEKLLTEVNRVYVIGNLIHNPLEMNRLKTKGLISVESVEDIPIGSYVVIRSHGLRQEEIEVLLKKDSKLVDATCPFVKRIRKVVQSLVDKGYSILLYGDLNHPEVQGVISYIKERVFVIEKERDLDFISISDKIGLVSQTTQELSVFIKLAIDLSQRVKELKLVNTICDATIRREKAVKDLVLRSDAILVVGGKNSANTKRLVGLCQGYLKNVYHIESPKEISGGWFKGLENIGLASGASTPDWQIKAVLAILRKYGGEVWNERSSSPGKCDLSC